MTASEIRPAQPSKSMLADCLPWGQTFFKAIFGTQLDLTQKTEGETEETKINSIFSLSYSENTPNHLTILQGQNIGISNSFVDG